MRMFGVSSWVVLSYFDHMIQKRGIKLQTRLHCLWHYPSVVLLGN
jgi:hypothetical protein